MGPLLSSLTDALAGSTAVALAAALAWGIASVLLSPCHLASVPLIVGHVAQRGLRGRGALLVSALFAIGVLVSIAVIGAATAVAGRLIGDVGRIGTYLLAVAFLYVGLNLLEVVPLPLPQWRSGHGTGSASAVVLGLVFGAAVGPCTFSFLAPVLGLAFKLASTRPGFTAGLLACFAIGHCGILAIAGGATGFVQRVLDWSAASRGSKALRSFCGVGVVLGGLWFLYSAP